MRIEGHFYHVGHHNKTWILNPLRDRGGCPLKFPTKYHTHTLKDMIFIQHWIFSRALRFKSSYVFLKCPLYTWLVIWAAKPPGVHFNINVFIDIGIFIIIIRWSWSCLIFMMGITILVRQCLYIYPDSKVHGANMGPIWGWQDQGGPHVGPMNFAIWVVSSH